MENKINFTYLIGAGASFGALPMVKGFADAVKNRRNNFNARIANIDRALFNPNVKEYEVLRSVLTELDYLYEVAKTYHTIDTYAKKLYLENTPKSKRELIRLKSILSIYFTIEQAYNPVEKRYDAFFASILTIVSGKLAIPPNIKVLSWNYDYQMELSISKFCKLNEVDDIDDFMNIIPRSKIRDTEVGFSMIKLNGVACSYIADAKSLQNRDMLISQHQLITDESEKYEMRITPTAEVDLFNMIINYLDLYKEYRVQPSMHFAWENKGLPEIARAGGLKAAKDTEILVVIGYSFPVYNREVDREIFRCMPNLRKIYFQVHEDDIRGVIQRFEAIRPFKYTGDSLYEEIIPVEITDLKEFFIPFEF